MPLNRGTFESRSWTASKMPKLRNAASGWRFRGRNEWPFLSRYARKPIPMNETLHKDFKEFFQSLIERKVKFLVIGGCAVAWLGRPRNTAMENRDLLRYPRCDLFRVLPSSNRVARGRNGVPNDLPRRSQNEQACSRAPERFRRPCPPPSRNRRTIHRTSRWPLIFH